MMHEGQVIRPSAGEKLTCIRSGLDGGAFVFDFELAAGAKGPPTHTHDEGDETIEVLEGEVVFRVSGEDRLLRAGDVCTLTPNDPHTFWNPSKSTIMRARVTHGARFERLIEQPSLTAMLMYAVFVDPGSSRPSSAAVRLAAPVVAWLGRLRGVRMVGVAEDAAA